MLWYKWERVTGVEGTHVAVLPLLASEPSSWGGAVELTLFAELFRVVLSVWNVQTVQSITFDGGGQSNAVAMGVLIFNGIQLCCLWFHPVSNGEERLVGMEVLS